MRSSGVDLLNCLDHDTSLKILMCLDDPSDLVRASCVSRAWRRFVAENGLCKQLCLKMFPALNRVVAVIEPSLVRQNRREDGYSENAVQWEAMEREHRAFAFLAHGLISFPLRSCILDPICASSTDNYPEESIRNTLEARDRIDGRASYWSSKGQSNAAVPEKLTYKLVSDICVIYGINIRPFQAYFQWGFPIYSPISIRFRMGHPKSPMDDPVGEPFDHEGDDRFVWMYTSPEFPVAQENRMQHFKLPEPVLCIGGILLIELLGRVQRQETDGLYYICLSHIQVVGRPLSPVFGVEILESSEKFVLRAHSYNQPSLSVERIWIPAEYLLEDDSEPDEDEFIEDIAD